MITICSYSKNFLLLFLQHLNDNPNIFHFDSLLILPFRNKKARMSKNATWWLKTMPNRRSRNPDSHMCAIGIRRTTSPSYNLNNQWSVEITCADFLESFGKHLIFSQIRYLHTL
jgi:hypothetical protein